MYSVYYREVKSGNNAAIWKVVHVSRFADRYNLELECFKEYEVAVTGSGARTRKPWKVKTGQGKKRYYSVDNEVLKHLRRYWKK